MTSDTLATRAAYQTWDAFFAHDWEAYAGFLADSFLLDDRRTGLKSSAGKVETLEMVRVMVDLGVNAVDIDMIETRGERFALYRLTVHVSEFVVALLSVLEADDNGLALSSVFFDEHDLDSARRELDSQAATAAE